MLLKYDHLAFREVPKHVPSVVVVSVNVKDLFALDAEDAMLPSALKSVSLQYNASCTRKARILSILRSPVRNQSRDTG